MRSLSASERRAGPLIAGLTLLRPRLPRLAIAVAFGVLALGSALTLAGVSAWLIAKAWQMPPILDLSVAVVAVRALGISRGVLGYCERLAHTTPHCARRGRRGRGCTGPSPKRPPTS